MAKRESKKVIAGITAEQYQDAMGKYAQADAMAAKKVAQMELELTKVREKYDGDLTSLTEEKDRQYEIVQTYAQENKATLFLDKRHIDNAHGKIGFRLGTPKLKTLRGWTWDRVLEKLESLMPEYVRVKKEVNKDALLDRRNDAEVAPYLVAVGVCVDQDESFFIELKKEE